MTLSPGEIGAAIVFTAILAVELVLFMSTWSGWTKLGRKA